jgi:hypothetical protein
MNPELFQSNLDFLRIYVDVRSSSDVLQGWISEFRKQPRDSSKRTA